MKRGNKGQSFMGMSFSTIFSIIIIVFILVVGFIVINSIIKSRDCSEIGIFISGFQKEIDKSWNSAGTEFIFKSNLPKNLKYVCFAEISKKPSGEFKNIWEEISSYQESNLFFYPPENSCIPFKKIQHLNLEKITKDKNPYCILIKNGKIEIKIEKRLDESLITLE